MNLNNNIYIGKTPAHFSQQEISGNEIIIEDEVFYKISNYNKMRPFFMSIVSNSDHWMFISSTGGLSAGRKNSNYALFPYYTDDKIEAAAGTGVASNVATLFDGQQKHISIAVIADGTHGLGVTTGGSFVPQLLS